MGSAVKLVWLKLHTVNMLMLPLMTILLSAILPSMQFPGQLRADTEKANKSLEEYLKLCNTLGIQPISSGYTAGGRYPATGGYPSYVGYPSYAGYGYPSNTGGYIYPSNTGGYAYPSNNDGYVYYRG